MKGRDEIRIVSVLAEILSKEFDLDQREQSKLRRIIEIAEWNLISREQVLKLAIYLKLSVEQTQQLLIATNNKELYIRNIFDAIYIYSLYNQCSQEYVDDIIKKESEE
jgi:hypothetical protein